MAIIGADIKRAKEVILSGELVAIPTETVYGLAADALNPNAVASIFSTKNRPSFDPLIVHLKAMSAVDKYAEWTEKASKLAKAFWPGPLTLLLKKKDIIPDLVTSGMEKVALRVPNQELTLQLLSGLNLPLVAPSANPFGYVSPTTAKHVNDQLGSKIPYILDGGPCAIGLESTIVGFDKNDEPTVYRLGGLSIEKIIEVIGPVQVKKHSSSNPQAPGMLKSHYSPSVKVRLGVIEEMLKEVKDLKSTGIISFQKRYVQVPEYNQQILASDGQMTTAAQNLFSALRSMDKPSIHVLLVEKAPDYGLGKAINDRLIRAAAQ